MVAVYCCHCVCQKDHTLAMTTSELAVFWSPFFMFSSFTVVTILFFSDAGFFPPEFFVAFHCSYRSSLEWWQGRTKSLVFFLRCTDIARRNPPDGFINTSIYEGDFAASLIAWGWQRNKAEYQRKSDCSTRASKADAEPVASSRDLFWDMNLIIIFDMCIM